MSKYDIVLFDFDGTLVDTGMGITRSIKYALGQVGIIEENEANLRRFIGPPLLTSFKNFYNLDDETCRLAVEKYRERYKVKCMEESFLYPKTEEMLSELKKRGIRIATASTKPKFFVSGISEHLGIDKYFDAVCGSELDGTRSDKKELIEYALEQLGSQGNESVAMVGDRCFDAIGARECGVDFIGVLFGFGSVEEFEKEGYTALCNDNDELLKVLTE